MKTKFPQILLTGVLVILFFTFSKREKAEKVPKLLVFSKTAGYRHQSIEAGEAALVKLGNEQGYDVDTTENAAYFNDDSLKNYSAVVFLSTTMNILNSPQENSFKRYIEAGGGFVGIHAAADTEYDWPWYNQLLGAQFLNHPKQQEAVINVVDKNNISTSHLPEKWKRWDEWYSYKNIGTDLKVLLSLDEKSYEGGKNGDNHPIAWYHEFDGGRAFYTGLGHTDESYVDPLFLKHLLGGIKYAIGNNAPLNYSKVSTAPAPENNRFVKTVLNEGTLYEPTELTVLPNLDVIVVQRRGEIMHYNHLTKKFTQAGFLNVYHKSTAANVNAEEGIMGVAKDPNFAKNNYIYLFYSPIDTSVNRLSRFKFVDNKLDIKSEKVVLQFYSQRNICCHTGGSIATGPNNMLYVSAGDNSTPFDVPKQPIANHGFAPLDNRPGLSQYDARRSAGNTNDLRGKILRIKIKEDGSYDIPEGNLFPPNTPKTRPEIYVMGNRNPYRISVDQKTGFLYWGEVGPDANADSTNRGPRGYDEVNQARKAGYFGWPLFIANNIPYKAYDYKTGTAGAPFDPAKPINDSPNNTGLTELPPAQSAFIYYPYTVSKQFPELGEGGRTAMAGPVYYADMYPSATRYPEYYNGKLIIYDWVRNWFKAVTMKPNGDYDSMEPFLSNLSFSAPMDFEIGPDGKYYAIEYGKGWFMKNPEASLVRIDYLAGNRPPQINELVIEKTSGLLPYKLNAKVAAVDPDKDDLTYVWNLGKGITKTTKEPSIQHSFSKAGTYPVSVTVNDANKASSKSRVVNVTAGNEAPKVNIAIKGNKTFYFPGKPVNYQVLVSDNGSTVIKNNVYVSSTYTEGNDMAGAPMGHQVVAETFPGKAIMLKADCKSCHAIGTKSIGPAFIQVSKKYQKNTKAVSYLTNKIIKGGAGAWGEVPMPAHSTMKETDVKKIAEWVMSLADQSSAKPSLPMVGKVTPVITSKNTDKKVFNLHAFYSDLGQAGSKPLSSTYTVSLMNNTIEAESIKDKTGLGQKDSSGTMLLVLPSMKGTMRFNKLDLSGINGINLNTISQGDETNFTVEVRLDGDTGTVIGNGVLESGSTRGDSNSKISIQPVTDGKEHNISIIFRSSNAGGKKRPLVKSVDFLSL
ncbi:MAG: Crp/Fnr family transcriptional regulator [Daejeonella sp.]|nr:Crp/Fnr family transcriptional regulator [Daejeonella sp.]